MRPIRTSRFVIHPSIDSLVERIGNVSSVTPAEEVTALREACLGKIRSYPADSYLRTVQDQVAGRAQYAKVAAFCDARSAGARIAARR